MTVQENDEHKYLSLFNFLLHKINNIESKIEETQNDIDDMIMMSMRTDGDTERFENAIKKLSDRICALREQLDLAKKQLSASDMVKGEIDRMKEALSRLDVTFSEYDDVTVRRLVECIRVMRGKRIVIILKGGLKIEEAIE